MSMKLKWSHLNDKLIFFTSSFMLTYAFYYYLEIFFLFFAKNLNIIQSALKNQNIPK